MNPWIMISITNRHVSRFIGCIAASILVLLGSCSSSSDEPEIPEDNTSRWVSLSIFTGNQTATRAASDNPYDSEEGIGAENYIDLINGDFRVYLFTTEGKLIKQLSQPLVAEEGRFDIEQIVGSTEETYRIKFRVDDIPEFKNVYTEKQSFKILMLANWGGLNKYPYVAPYEDIDIESLLQKATEHIGDYRAGELVSASNLIPFYGIRQFDNVRFREEITVLEGMPLNLQRAFARIEVFDETKDEDNNAVINNLSSVRLVRYNTRFDKLPADLTNYLTSRELSLPAENNYEWETDETVGLWKEKTGHFVIHVPEYKNTGRNENERTKLIVTYNGESGYQEYVLDFKYYEGGENPPPPSGSNYGDYYDLCRNYSYKFYVKRNKYDISLTAKIKPYYEVELDPEFGN